MATRQGKTLAERKFNERVRDGVAGRDFGAVAKAYGQFGTYLELVGQDTPVGEPRSFEPAPTPVPRYLEAPVTGE